MRRLALIVNMGLLMAYGQGATTSKLRALASVENGLPYDGCSFPIMVGGQIYAPSADSQKQVSDFAGATIGKTDAKIDYELTGNSMTVACGWGGETLPEIRVLSIAAP